MTSGTVMAGKSTTSPRPLRWILTHGRAPQQPVEILASVFQQLLLEVDRRKGLHKWDDGRLSMSPFDTVQTDMQNG
jgi:hypothetical protein